MPTTQLVVVICCAFGLFIFYSVADLLELRQGHLSETGFRSVLVYEAFVLAMLAAFLSDQGWSLRDFGFPRTVRQAVVQIALGVALALAVHFLYVAVWRFAAAVFPAEMRQAAMIHRELFTSRIELATAVAVAVVNPFFEEMFGCGFVISSLERARWPLWAAIGVSAAIRVLYHLYQGIAGIISMLPIGIAFAYWYARSKLLLPVIVAHGLLDMNRLLDHLVR